MVINLIILDPINFLNLFLCHPHLNLHLIQDENQGIIIKLGSDAFNVIAKSHPSIPFKLTNIINRMGRIM